MCVSRASFVVLSCLVGLLATRPAACAEPSSVKAPPCRVGVDSRVELMSIIFRLAGNPEYNTGQVKAYADDVDKHFGPFRDHAAVKLAQKLRNTRGVSFDACMSMAVHLPSLDDKTAEPSFSPRPKALDSRWTAGDARKFAAATRQFAKDASFDEFIKKHRSLYDVAESRLRTLLDKEAHLEWFGDFFGDGPEATFAAVPALLNGGNCYGARCQTTDGKKEIYCIIGVWSTDKEGMPKFSRGMGSTVVHEFCHSYANPVVERHLAELKAAGQKIFPHVAAQMRSQAYGNWQTMFYESLVRACGVRHARRYEGTRAASQEIQYNQVRGFAWTKELSDLLGEYEADRQRYPSLEAFSPRLVAFFNEYAEKFDREQTALAARRPKIVSMTPANGATNVDPALTAIVVVFDRPMKDGCWAMCGGGPHCPETVGDPSYDAKRTTWTYHVKLKPDWDYQFMLNSDQFSDFQSEEGVPLAPVTVTFKTVKKVVPGAKSPKIVSMTPANGAKDVDPGLTEIKVVFDRPMKDGSWAMCAGVSNALGLVSLPKTVGEPSYDATRTTWTVRVKLKPNQSYGFTLNSALFMSFQSEEGVLLEPVTVVFKTAKETGKP